MFSNVRARAVSIWGSLTWKSLRNTCVKFRTQRLSFVIICCFVLDSYVLSLLLFSNRLVKTNFPSRTITLINSVLLCNIFTVHWEWPVPPSTPSDDGPPAFFLPLCGGGPETLGPKAMWEEESWVLSLRERADLPLAGWSAAAWVHKVHTTQRSRYEENTYQKLSSFWTNPTLRSRHLGHQRMAIATLSFSSLALN